jgi:hypothetical protein
VKCVDVGEPTHPGHHRKGAWLVKLADFKTGDRMTGTLIDAAG